MTLQTHNSKKNKTPLWLSMAGLFAAGLLTATLVHAQAVTPPTEPHQEPLIMGGGVSAAPNIAIIYDDSGSMNNVAIPDDAAPMHYVSLHPEDIGLPNQLPYNEIRVIPTNANEIAAVLIRSHQINPLYYNPATTYHPWKNANGEPITERDKIKPKSVPTYANTFRSVIPARNSYIDLTEVDKVYHFNADGSSQFRGMRRGYCSATTASPFLSCNGWVIAGSHKFTPAVYFIYEKSNAPGFKGWSTTDPNIRITSNYTRIAIMDILDSGPKEGRGILQKNTRTDCTTLPSSNPDYVRCSRDEEMQNFAVWYVFYRDRIRAATGALSQVFAQKFDTKFRVGWWALNRTWTDTGVRSFELNTPHAAAFFDWIFNFEIEGAVGSTPTLGALDRVGKYLTKDEPWYENPAKPDSKPLDACRRNYAIVMTDGGWNDSFPPTGYFDLSGEGKEIVKAGGATKYQYKGVLSPGVNNYPYYNSVAGNSLARSTLYYWATDLRPDLSNALPGTGYDGTAFWQNLVTHTIGFGVSGDLDFPNDLDALKNGTKTWGNPASAADGGPAKIDDLWHAALNGQGTYASAGNLDDLIASLSSILANIVTGEIRSPHTTLLTDKLSADNNVLYSPQYTAGKWAGELSANAIKEVGTGIEISPTAIWKASENIPAHGDRNIFVGVDTGGDNIQTTKFSWGDISKELKDYLNNDKKLLDYIRGDNTPNSDFRTRNGTLGDIVNSAPEVIQERANLGYKQFSGYQDYRALMKARAGMVFVGANDGMLHGFDLATGVEKFAYIPYGITHKLSKLAAKDYETKHTYYVDGPLTSTDVYWSADPVCGIEPGKCWKNILVGTAGAGGKSVFAIDVTDESNYTKSSAVLWDLSEKSDGLSRLGSVMQPVQTGYAKTGDWIGVFGNGAYGEDGHAILYVVDLKTGALLKEITVDTSGDNGLMSVTLVKDKAQVIVEAYAADLKGNLWRIKLNTSDYGAWGNHLKLFTTKNGRAITHAPVTKAHPLGGRMVVFGTGKFFDVADRDTDTGTDALYGIWDKGDNSAVTYSQLIERTVTAIPDTGGKYFQLTGDTGPINWNTQRGWTLPLTMAAKQRNLYAPRLFGNDVFFDTTIASINAAAAESCEVEGLKGIVLLLDLFSGGKPAAKWSVQGITGDVIGIYNPNDGEGHLLTGGLVPGGSNPDPSTPWGKFQIACRSTGGVPAISPIDNSFICAPATDFYSWVTLR